MDGYSVETRTVVFAPGGAQWVVRDVDEIDGRKYAEIARSDLEFRKFLKCVKVNYAKGSSLISELESHREAALNAVISSRDAFGTSPEPSDQPLTASAKRKRKAQVDSVSDQDRLLEVSLPAFVCDDGSTMPETTTLMPKPNKIGTILVSLDIETVRWIKMRFSVLSSPSVYESHKDTPLASPQKGTYWNKNKLKWQIQRPDGGYVYTAHPTIMADCAAALEFDCGATFEPNDFEPNDENNALQR